MYIASDEFFIKDISKSVKDFFKKFMKLNKPPDCQKLFQNGKKYRLIPEPETEIVPTWSTSKGVYFLDMIF